MENYANDNKSNATENKSNATENKSNATENKSNANAHSRACYKVPEALTYYSCSERVFRETAGFRSR